MTPAYVALQAKAFLEWLPKTGLEWDLAFVSWARDKHLDVDAYNAIRSVVHSELVALGVLSLDDLPEWAGDAGDDADDEDSGRNQAAA